MKVKDIITITRASNEASTGYCVSLVKLEKLALLETSYTPPPSGLIGAPGTKHFTFQAIAAGNAEIQFAKFRPWLLPQEILYEDVLPIDVEPADEADAEDAAALTGAILGGWSNFAVPNADEKAVFTKAFAKLVGVDYEPLLVTKQGVNGTNYIFAVNAKVVYPDSVPYAALVRIYNPTSGEAKIVKITQLGSPSPHFVGGYGAFREINDSDKPILDTALKGLAGSRFTANLVSTQVVAGRNYRFAGTLMPSTEGSPEYPALLTVYQPLSGKPVITGVERVYELV